jgi:subtilisin family serine protease
MASKEILKTANQANDAIKSSDAAPKNQAPMLDTSSAGMPFSVSVDSGYLGASGVGQEAPSSGEDLIIEVEFASNAVAVAGALAADTAGFLRGVDSNALSSQGYGLGGVLNQLAENGYQLKEARAVFSQERILADEAHTAALGAAGENDAATMEALPPLSSYVRLRFPAGAPAKKILEALKKTSEIKRAAEVPRAAPPAIFIAATSPSDPLIGKQESIATNPETGLETQWYLHRTGVSRAWSYARGANVVVADIDWGFRTTHQELAGGIEQVYNAVGGGNDVTQGAYAAHGTAVLAIAGARSDEVGMAGYAPEASLWAIQADSTPDRQLYEEPWAEAIDFVRRTDSNGRRKVIILEVQTSPALGNYEQIPSVSRAIRAAIADNCIVCVAAGNGDRRADLTDNDEPFDPTGSILVGATAYHESLNKRASFSNFGSRIVVSAPGDPSHDLTCGQAADNAYRNGFGGTSGATPKVAGTVALMLSVNPTLSHHDVRAILIGTGSAPAEDPGKPIGVFLNTEAAVAEALRRRSDKQPDEPFISVDGQPSPKSAPLQPLHGIRRRRGQLVLPDANQSRITWNMPEATHHLSKGDFDTPQGEQAPTGDKTLRLFRESVEGTLTQQDRILIVQQAIRMLDNFYVHRPLKEAMHAVRPIQGLKVLLRRLQQEKEIPASEKDELKFHNTLTQIFNSVRDLHTCYQLPQPYRDYIAYLPFEVSPFNESGKKRYLVTRVVPGYAFSQPDFGPGAEILYWNGMAIERAIQANADQTAGSNEAARHARGVSALTIRAMNTALPPSADFVDIDFIPRGMEANDSTASRAMRQHWFVRFTSALAGVQAVTAAQHRDSIHPAEMLSQQRVSFHSALDLGRESVNRASSMLFEPESQIPVAAAPTATIASPKMNQSDLRLAASLGLDIAADAVREARQLIFEPDMLDTLQQASVGDSFAGVRGSASPESLDVAGPTSELPVTFPWNGAFRASIVQINGTPYGHIRVRTFYVTDADGFVQEFVRILGKIPASGLILDVRGNGGGNIWAAERLLQTLTAAEIEPERMQFIATPGTQDLCRHNRIGSQIRLDAWLPSLEGAIETGAVYSEAFPLTDKDSCNAIGQKYYGPVVLLVDGNCYSATDIFAAGFQDHKIGKVLGVSGNTGAGGANVWEHRLLHDVLPPGWGLKPLPNKAGMRVAIRQSLRVGPRTGALLEDFGVLPDEVHAPQREDIMNGDRMLLRAAAKLLAAESVRSITVTMGEESAVTTGHRSVTIKTIGLKRLDFYLDGRPEVSVDIYLNGTDNAILTPSMRSGARLKLVGFVESDSGSPAAAYRGLVP